jgi:hypothetical protein
MDSSEPQPPTAEIHQSKEDDEKKKLPIKTYHCRFCSHLLIASTRELLSSRTPLRRRRQLSTIEGGGGGAGGEGGGAGGLDGAMILELPSSKTTRTNTKRKSYDGEERGGTILGPGPGPETETAVAAATTTGAATTAAQAEEDRIPGKNKTEQAHYTIPLSTLLPDAAPIIIRREDGFEKRVLLRCGRCRVVVGYKLPPANITTAPTAEEEEDEEEEEEEYDDENGLTTKGKGEKAIYLLPGSIVGTEDLDVGFTEADGTGGGRGGGGDALNAMIDRNPVLKGMEEEWMEWVK